jgi:hypothetical protein
MGKKDETPKEKKDREKAERKEKDKKIKKILRDHANNPGQDPDDEPPPKWW